MDTETEMKTAPSFESRVSRVFGSLGLDLASHSSSPFWTISEEQYRQRQIDGRGHRLQWSQEVPETRGEDDEVDTPCALRYEKFLRLQRGEYEEASALEAEWKEQGNLGAEKRVSGDGATEKGNGALEWADTQDWDDDEEVQEEEEEEEEKEEDDEEEGGEDEVEQMRQMIGMDETLDFEDEEDEYDKVAVGREGSGERIYMNEICGSDSMQSSCAALPRSLYEMKQVARDSRANHSAAAARLAEDARGAAANGECGLHLFNGQEKLMNEAAIRPALKSPKEKNREEFLEVPSKGTNQNSVISELAETLDVRQQDKHNSSYNLMKWKATGSVVSEGVNDCSRVKKRVRFAEDLRKDNLGNSSEEEDHANVLLARGPDIGSIPRNVSRSDKTSDNCSKVPDHVKHPWKYTHYTLDWSDDATASCESENIKAFQAVRKNCKDTFESEQLTEIPKSISFSPRNKQVCESRQMISTNFGGDSGAAKASNVEHHHLLTLTADIAAEVEQEKDALMLVDSLSPTDSDNNITGDLFERVKTSRQPRNYRSRKS